MWSLLFQFHRLTAALEGTGTTFGNDKLRAAFSTAIPFSNHIGHNCVLLLNLKPDNVDATLIIGSINKGVKALYDHGLFSNDLQDDLPGPGAIIEIYHDDLLPGPQGKFALTERDGERGT